ncbi:MAG: trimeric intracellular cation channel family protein [Candidatus Saccharibacteria bacterium]|nr:trimeric intracellular cation channel family protein [Moraxellaceae bacterium]
MLTIIYIIAITAEAMTGALSAGRRSMDLFGVVLIACVTALGGGSVRDVLLGHYPLTWVKHPEYLALTGFAALITVVIAPLMKHLKSVFLVLDALGLVAFTILGCQVALEMQQEGLIKQSLLISAVFGVITGVFGGILRDILCNDIPLIFQKELYASVALASAVLYLGCLQLNLVDEQSMIITLFGGFLFRLLAIKYHWEIPKFVYQDEHSIDKNQD